MIGIILGVIFTVIAIIFWIIGGIKYEDWIIGIGWVCLCIAIGCFIIIPPFTGVINYKETNDYDKARITAVDTVQTPFRLYWKIDVEYLTNTPTQDGIVTNRNIETDIYYTDNEELVKVLRENMYKEVIVQSGFKGGYETWKTHKGKLIKNIQLIQE